MSVLHCSIYDLVLHTHPQHVSYVLQVLPAQDPILLKLHGEWLHYCVHKQAFVRVPDVPEDLPEQLAAALEALEEIEKGDARLNWLVLITLQPLS